MSDETAYASPTYAEAHERERAGTLRGWLLFKGIDWRTMTAKQEGDPVLYSGPKVIKGDALTKGNCGGGNGRS